MNQHLPNPLLCTVCGGIVPHTEQFCISELKKQLTSSSKRVITLESQRNVACRNYETVRLENARLREALVDKMNDPFKASDELKALEREIAEESIQVIEPNPDFCPNAADGHSWHTYNGGRLTLCSRCSASKSPKETKK